MRATVSSVNSATGGAAIREGVDVRIFDAGAGSCGDKAVFCAVDHSDVSKLAVGGEGAGAVVMVTTSTVRQSASPLPPAIKGDLRSPPLGRGANTGGSKALLPPPGDMAERRPLPRVEGVFGRSGGRTAADLKAPSPEAPVATTEDGVARALSTARATASRALRSGQSRAAATLPAMSGFQSPLST